MRLKLHPAHFLFIAIVVFGALLPKGAEQALTAITKWFEHSFGWLVLLVCAFFVCFCFYIAFGKYGSLRLGGPDERPQFSTLSWLAMLFAAGMGAGLVFYGAAEPLLHYMKPPPAVHMITEGAEQARRAMVISYFHWGIHAWAIYAVAALSIAYFTFHRNSVMLPSVPIGSHPWVNVAIDSFAVMAVVFGLVASLANGILQISDGVRGVAGVALDDITLKLLILLTLFVAYMASASTGIGKGIKILSDINISVAILLMLFVLFCGPTHFIMESFVSGIGDYLDSFTYLTFNVRHFSDAGGWTERWTITYFLWWVSWGPFVGVFIARISRGRTLKEFLLGVILVPTLFSALWFATLGGTAIHLEMIDQPGFGEVVSTVERTTFAVLETLPMSEITSLAVLFLLFIFLVTSADSGTYVLGMFTTNGALNPSVWQRLFWGVMIGVVTAGTILTGEGSSFFRSFAVVGSIPYLFIMLWQTYGLWKAIRKDVGTHPSP